MATIAIALSDERLATLKELTNRLHVDAEDLLRVTLEDLLAQPNDIFRQTVERILTKN